MFSKVKSSSGKSTMLSAAFIEKFMPNADGNFVKVYITGLYNCENSVSMTNAEIANSLMLLESDVIRAWKYWESMGAVKIEEKNGEIHNIVFLDLDTPVQKVNIETKPVYTIDEVTKKINNENYLKDVYKMAERILEKPLSTNDMLIIYSLYDYYRMPLDVIPLLLEYCMNNGKKSMRAIERVAQNWTDNEINSHKRAEEYLKYLEEVNSKSAKLKRMLGINSRNFTATEKKFVNLWLFQLKISCNLVAYAADLTVNSTGKMSFAYMNKILQDWHGKGIKTPNEAAKYRNQYKKSAPPPGNAKPTKFTNFSQPDFDYDALEKRALGKK